MPPRPRRARLPLSSPRYLRSLALGAVLAGAASGAYAWELKVCADPNAMPQSNSNAEGYENKIIETVAADIGAEVSYVWWAVSPSMIRDQLREGHCDVLIGMPDGTENVLGTLAYYRSPYAFVYRSDADYEIRGFDDPILAELQIGTTTEGNSTHLAFARRGYLDNLHSSSSDTGTNSVNRFTNLLDDVASGKLDVALPWGPVAGYFAAQYDGALTVTPVPEFDFPMIPMYHSIIMVTRMGDESLRDLLDIGIARRWEEIYEILAAYHVPTLDMPRPRVSVEGQ